MIFKKIKCWVLLLVSSALLLALKLFTAVVYLKDDPSVLLILRLAPSFETHVQDTVLDNSTHLVLITDENGFMGEGLYYFAINYLWWLLILLAFLCYVRNRQIRD